MPRGTTAQQKRKATRPQTVLDTIGRISRDTAMNDAMLALEERKADFSTPMAAKLAGIAMNEAARQFMDDQLNTRWKQQRMPSKAEEVIIGGGLHAAIYSAVRVAQGFPKPVIIERKETAGGAFKIGKTNNGAFFLNSRNRPGELGTPGDPLRALNVLPGAPVQPSDISGEEYQRNTDLAYVVRMTLGMDAIVTTDNIVISGKKISSRYELVTNKGKIVCERVIDATGLGQQVPIAGMDQTTSRVFTFNQFMQRMDQQFPLRGLNRVAVVGAGDSGRTVVECLVGQGPTQNMSVAAIDYPKSITWFGMKAEEVNKAGWLQCNRPRYYNIARYLPTSREPQRIVPKTGKVTAVSPGYNCVYVGEEEFDAVILCTGYGKQPVTESIMVDLDETLPGLGLLSTLLQSVVLGSRVIARKTEMEQVYCIGAGARLERTPTEQTGNPNIPENVTAIFRYASKTATLASTLHR